MLFDTHTHLNFEGFQNTWREITADCLAHDINLLNVGAQLETSKKAIAIAESFTNGVYASVGLHPIHVPGSTFHPENFDVATYQQLIDSSKKVKALGETGIDFFHDEHSIDEQIAVFRSHLELAQKNNLPVIIHGRNSKDGSKSAYDVILKTLDEYPVARGVGHCFGGNVAEAKMFADRGFYIGITGIVTFKKADVVVEIVKTIPLEQLVIETDAPYLAPEPHRGEENKPQYVEFVARKIAQIKGLSYEAVAQQTTKNAKALYGIGN